jgi:predicted nucleic acid-binding protein
LTVVLDSNVVVALVTKDERAATVGRQMQMLSEEGEPLHAPSLLRYEVANALTRKVVAGELDLADAETAWHQIAAMPIALHDLNDGPGAVGIALRLRRESAYDASYVALAQKLDADLLTLDGPLARNAASAGLPVRLIETTSS